MKLVLRRSQRAGGLISKTVVFGLDARAELTKEEGANVTKYKLGGEVVYNSQTAQRHYEKVAGADYGTLRGFASGLTHFAMAKLALTITIDSLVRGHHIE